MRRAATWIAGALLAYATLTALGAIDESAGGERIAHPAGDVAGSGHVTYSDADAAQFTIR